MRYLIKLDRLAAWVLLLSMLLYFVSGYGMTKGIMNSSLAIQIHNNILPYIAFTAFIIHTAYATRLAFIRWKIWRLFKYIWGLFFILAIVGFIYVASFYKKPEPPKPTNQTDSAVMNETSTQTSSVKTFSTAELSKYNGRDGQPAYVAVDGNVYDLSEVFESGAHFSHFAGTELTNAFYSYHAKSALSKYPIVGNLEK